MSTERKGGKFVVFKKIASKKHKSVIQSYAIFRNRRRMLGFI